MLEQAPVTQISDTSEKSSPGGGSGGQVYSGAAVLSAVTVHAGSRGG